MLFLGGGGVAEGGEAMVFGDAGAERGGSYDFDVTAEAEDEALQLVVEYHFQGDLD